MPLDTVSEYILGLVLKIKGKNPGLISELWIDTKTVDQIKEKYEDVSTDELISKTDDLIKIESDVYRKDYLYKLLNSIKHQLLLDKDGDLKNYYENTLDFEIAELTESQIESYNQALINLEKETKLTRFEVIKKSLVPTEVLTDKFNKYLEYYKNRLPKYLETSGEFDIEVVNEAPWGAFNSHIAPFKSKLTLNSSIGITTFDLKHFAVHEAYGGHHTELSLKDGLLIDHGRGEHGFVLVYSPQVFISEGIAEAAFEIFGYDEEFTSEEKVINAYQNLSFALSNKAAFMYHNAHISKDDVTKYIENYKMGDLGTKNITNFVFDTVFGKYPAIYLSAKKFILDLYNTTGRKKELLLDIYKNPCTPSRLKRQY